MAALLLHFPLLAADTFRVATYNLENYLDQPSGNRPAKSEEAKAAVREGILLLKPDVLALEEMGGTNELLELQGSLKSAGVDLPHWELITGSDTNIHVAILSRFPFTARRPHTEDSFLLAGRRFRICRGFAEVDIQVNASYSFTLIAAHLKSRLTIPEADEADVRLEEAKILRRIIDADLAANPRLNLVVLGDFNDLHNSDPLKTILGPHGKQSLVDTRPAEKNSGDPPQTGRASSRSIAWTDYYSREDSYSRIDYILLSHGMAHEWNPEGTYVLTRPDWGVASDHRPLVATFTAEDR